MAFTMQTYAHIVKETQQQLADTMDSILVPVEKPKPVAPQAPRAVLRAVN